MLLVFSKKAVSVTLAQARLAYSFDADTYAQEDLNLFFANFTPQIPQGTHPTLDAIDGAVAPVPVDEAGGESDLDFQLIYPIVYPIEVVLYQVDDPPYADGEIPTAGFGNTFLDALVSKRYFGTRRLYNLASLGWIVLHVHRIQ